LKEWQTGLFVLFLRELLRLILKETKSMKEPGLDGRHRDKNSGKGGQIQQKRSDTLNKNLPKPIPQFPANMTLGTMRKKTGETSEAAVRRVAARMKK
jgi:hypothetical protein